MKKILQALALLTFSLCSYAQITWTNGSGSTNNWATEENWDAVAIPSSADEVIFDGLVSNASCFIGEGAECASLTIQNGYSGTIEVDAGVSVSIGMEGGGNFIIAGSGFSGKFILNSGATLNVGGSFTINTNNNDAEYYIHGDAYLGNLSVLSGMFDAGDATALECNPDVGGGTGNFSMNGSTFTAPSGTMIVVGSIANRTSGTFNANGGTVRQIIRFNRNIGSGFTLGNAFNNLIVGVSGAQARSLTVSGNVTVNGNLGLETTGALTLTINNNQLNVSGNVDNSLNFATSGSGGTTNIRLVGNSAQSIIGNTLNTTGGALPAVTIAQLTNGTVNLSGRINLARGLTINSNGAITPNTSTLSFLDGVNAATITGTTTTNVALYDLLINKSGSSLSISSLSASWVTVSHLLTVTAGTFNTGNKVALLSTASNNSAFVGPVTGTISGSVRVDRFITGATGRKWRFLASPVTTTTFISGNWQQNIHITGVGSGGSNCPSLTANSNGFDATASSSPSMYTYSESVANWASVANTNSTNLAPGTGYRMFIRGNRSQGCALLNGANPAAQDVTLSATGTLATGNQTQSLSFGTGNGWHLVGNPYQAPIDWERVTAGNRTNVDDFFQIFDPNGGIGGTGAYVTYNGATNSSTGNVNQYIGPGHAFWVKANAGGASITFEEADKEVTSTGTTLFKTSDRNPNDLSIRVLDQNDRFDEVVAAFNTGANPCYDAGKDIEKFQFEAGTGNIALFTSCDQTRYSINAIPVADPNKIDTLFLHLRLPANTSAAYRLQFNGLATAIASESDVYLVDRYTNTFHNLRASSTYSFSTVANNTSSQGAGRFIVVYGGDLSTLPVKLVHFDVSRSGNKAEVSWITSAEQNSRSFTVERSSDGKHYTEAGTVNAKGVSSVITKYSLTDAKPLLGAINYYRLKMLDHDGTAAYSVTRSVDFREGEAAKAALVTEVFPVPAKDKLTLVVNSNMEAGNLEYMIYDLAGKLVMDRQQVTASGSAANLEIALPSSLKPGFYFMDLSAENGQVQRIKFVTE